jgi:hypothetical protein
LGEMDFDLTDILSKLSISMDQTENENSKEGYIGPVEFKSKRKLGDIFHYAGQDEPGAIRKMKLLDEKYISSIPVLSVQKILRKITEEIKKYEFNSSISYKLERKIFEVEDVVFMVTCIGRWRRGFGYVVLQISEKNGGSARVSVYTTNTIFHDAICFGTNPCESESMELIDKYVNVKNIDTLTKDLALLKTKHSTKKTVTQLISSLQY